MPTSACATAARSRLVAPAALARPLSRGGLFGFACLLLTLNAFPTFVGEAGQAHGWLLAALNLYDISAIVWLALAAGTALAWRDNLAPPDRGDWAMAILAIAVALVPVPALSGAGLTAVAGWGFWRSAPRSDMRRSAAIFLSISTFLIWGRILLALGAGPLLSADARFVSLLSGTSAQGNVVWFANGHRFLIAPGCSSLHGISLALVLWTTAVMWFDLRVTARLLWTLVFAVAASVLVNGVRLAVIAWDPVSFEYWHSGTGALAFGWLALIVVAGVVYRGVEGALK